MFDLVCQGWSQRHLQKPAPDAITYCNPVRYLIHFPSSLVLPNEVKKVIHFCGSIKIPLRTKPGIRRTDTFMTPPPRPHLKWLPYLYVIGRRQHWPFENVLMKVDRREMIEWGFTLLNKVAERWADGLSFCYHSIAIIAAAKQLGQCCI